MRLLVILLALLGTTAPQAPRNTSVIRGIVVQPGTLQPIARAEVRLAIRDSRLEPLTFTTGADGRFEFQNVPAGSYDLMASRNGFLPTSFGQRGPSGSGRKLTIEAGTNVENIRLVMAATGAISGRVTDNTGEPVANMPVQALRYSYEDGKRTLQPVKTAQTNDFGEFRIFWLPPGQYYISAQPIDDQSGMRFVVHSGLSEISVSRDGAFVTAHAVSRNGTALAWEKAKPGVAFVPVYYPGTADPQSASRVEVRPGGDIRGIDFILTPISTRKVRGTVLASTAGQPVQVANVQLLPRGDIGNPLWGILEEGKFEISGVLPGSYSLVATARTGTSDDVKIFGGRTAVEVGPSDLDNVNVTLEPTVDIAGRLSIDGRPVNLSSDARPVIFLQGQRTLPGQAQAFAAFSDATQFEISTVFAGDYRIRWNNVPPGMYVKSVRFGPVDALTSDIRIDSRTAETIQVVLGTNAGAIEGVVRDNVRNLVPGARVVLVPDAARRELTHLYQSTTTDDSGRFHLQGIAPGDYSLFAWEDVEEGQWQDAEFLKRHESAARSFRISESSRETIETVAIPFAF